MTTRQADQDTGRRPPRTTLDAFLGGAVMIEQPATSYRAGLDAVLLAAACHPQAADTILDAGSGVGVVGLCIANRIPGTHLLLVEREPELATLAAANVARNSFSNRIDVMTADLTLPLSRLPELAARVGTFHHVVANPPFYGEACGTPATDPLKATAHAMTDGSLDDWARFLAAMAAPHATLTMIHRAEKLDEILAVLERRFGGLRLRPIHPRTGQPASRILVTGKKGSRAPLVHSARPDPPRRQVGFRPEIEAILRHGAALQS